MPVLLDETISSLVINPHGIYVDCTMGGGGHLRSLLSKLEDDAQVLAIDKDKQILEENSKAIDKAGVKFIHGDFRNLKAIMKNENIAQVDGIMIDLGVSSFQLDNAQRGFSFHEDADLDMRMDREQELSARDIVNKYSEKELLRILFEYGEERYARRIVKSVVNYRSEKYINTTLELVDIIKSSVPAAYRREKHPARKTFQALRIAVNSELDALQGVLPQALELLKPAGRLCIITFHSLEDRIVKRFFQEKVKGCICPPGMPLCICGQKPQLQLVSRKPIVPSENECLANPRARSAKLRVASKL
ncbi:MAG: 16S rRNA (cytosine(1402)-N(4))-methyltransferase RsmH [Syntrophomonadaceae bacterium]|nr:16S rRNA (cytosine(1402)-N(4))-methyltransferase RsmH [Syntrophomonadaceae bacterium]MDD3024933.1 16S rRNA (cytosine(1402)-N(4))-methyltransferase RsmH [Syntrophomonadaceae bacterium]